VCFFQDGLRGSLATQGNSQQPSGEEKFPFLYVHYSVICGSYNKFINPEKKKAESEGM
jgi:hypothetical protein